MSTNLVESEILRFVASKEPEVLCISGKWGIGKTFSWNYYLRQAQGNKAVALERCAYVSLFGINSLDELKYSIFENTVRTDQVGAEPSLASLKSVIDSAEGLGRKYAWLANLIPILKSYAGGAAPAFFLTVRNQVICIDDLERKGKNLEVGDVLGLISFLKEQRHCKIVLLLNDQALPENGKREFGRYLEKVVDVSLKFTPSAEDAVRIALTDSTKASKLISENCVALGISNIRVIGKIERVVHRIAPMLIKFDELVLRQAVQSLTLLCWSVYETEAAPPLEYLTEKRGKNPFGIEKEGDIKEDEAAWDALLDVYGFAGMDEFDLMLLEGVRNGFFDPAIVEKQASDLNKKINMTKSDSSFEAAWRMYHDSFDDNQELVLDTIHDSFVQNVQAITPINLNGTVRLLKELGRPEQAAKVINHYIESRKDDRKFFDLDDYAFGADITDPDVIKAFRDKFASFRDDRDPADILLKIAKSHSWNPEDVRKLSTLSADDYYRIFKQRTGTDLSRIISACLQFGRIVDASASMKEISKLAKDALIRIGKESPINARRVRKYGVEIGD